MKILQILPELNSGGVERGTCEVAEYLVQQGHQSIVVSNGGRLVKRLEDEGSTHIQLPVHRKSLMSLFQIKPLRRLFEQEKPDIIHARSRVPAWLAYLAWKTMPQEQRPHFMTTFHGFYSVNAYSKIMTQGERIIAVSESIQASIIRDYNVPESKIQVIHRGVSSSQYPFSFKPNASWLENWQQQHPELKDRFIVTLPGRISRWKGHQDFLRIIAALVQQNIPVYGLIAGGCHPKKIAFETELRQLAHSLNIQNHVVFLGDRTDLKEIMSISDVVVSLSNKPEAFGRVSLEAMCLGRPVIAYHHGGVGEQIDAMFPAGSIAANDWQAAADRITTFYQHPPAPPTKNHFTLEKMLEDTLSVYQSIIQEPSH